MHRNIERYNIYRNKLVYDTATGIRLGGKRRDSHQHSRSRSMLNATFTVDNNDVDVREEEVDITAVEDDYTKEISRTRAVGVGCIISKPEQQYFCIERFMGKPQDFECLTGFVLYVVMNIFSCCSEHWDLLLTSCPTDQTLTPENELFITLVKLRQGKDDMQLYIDFNVDRTVVGKIFNTWINFMYYELGEFDWWLPREVIDEHFPKGFKNMFPTTRLYTRN